MARRRGKGRFESEEEDPMAGTSNLVDAMPGTCKAFYSMRT